MSLPPPSVNKDGYETDRSLLKRMGVRRENPSSGDQDQAQVQALYSSDMPVSEPSDGESLANFHFEFFTFELREL